jgi:hypothetical protein
MTTTIKLFLTRLARGPQNQDAHVHFHQGPSGSPAACHEASCDLPRLSV